MAVEDTKENREKCLCPDCPSYPHDCKGEILYCGLGKSDCEIKARGCNCSNCPVYYEYKLNGLFYCDKEEGVGSSNFMMRKKRSNENDSFYQSIVNIKDIANTGESIPCSMGSLKKLPFLS